MTPDRDLAPLEDIFCDIGQAALHAQQALALARVAAPAHVPALCATTKARIGDLRELVRRLP